MDGASLLNSTGADNASAGHVLEIRGLAEELAALSAPNEKIFLALGDALSNARSSFLALNRHFEHFAALTRSERTDGVAALLAQALERHSPLLRNDQATADQLRNIDHGTTAMVRPLGELLRITAEIKTLAINAKVEAAHIDSDSVDFSVFTTDIGRMGATAATAVTQGVERLEGLRGIIARAQKIQQESAGMDRHELEAVQTDGERRLAEFKRWREQSHVAVADLATSRDHIAADIARCVELLQINDMTAQRLAHCGEALDSAAGLLAGDRRGTLAWAAEMEPQRRSMLAAALCRLQARQLERAADDFRSAAGGLKNRLGSLAQEAATAKNTAFAVLGAGEGSDGLCAALRADGERVLATLRAGADLNRQVRAMIGSLLAGLEELARDMAGIRAIDADMRLMGLNAGLKCERLAAKGRALAVVAQELRASSRRTDAALTAIDADAQTVRAAACALEEAAEERTGQTAEVGAMLQQWIDAVITVGGDLDAALAPIRGGCEETATALRRTAEDLRADEQLHDGCRRIVDRLLAAADAIRPEAPGDKAEVAQLLAMLKDQYTMASERTIHALFSESDPAAAARAPGGASAADDDPFL